ncbi:MAG: hypothetical protein IPO95_02710 [Rhodanobacteraceae bacterium]|nr:hypothetical protein [Rhodanobacteraceae bacterium]MBL0041375.1 hypothetical protein [Xanthomonadales bacterium]MBP6077413.1 hypothetical protein [Xanthomonadales bacterium]MBP7624420.1 hypothetical protein [Xanthomonadales bacterium]
MLRIVEIILAVVFAVLFFIVLGLFFGKDARITRSVEVGNPITQVYDSLNGFHNLNQWNPWQHVDPNMTKNVSGEAFGVGSRLDFQSSEKRVGNGSLQLVESTLEDDGVIRFAVENDWLGKNKQLIFRLKQDPKTRSVSVIAEFDVEYGWNVLGRYAGLYLDGRIGEDLEIALARFATTMATVPMVDYSQMVVEEVELPGQNILYVGGGIPAAPRKWDEAQIEMDKAWKQVEDFMKAERIVATGPKLRVVNVLGEEFNDFSMAYPIESDAVAVKNNVRIGKSYAGKALKLQFVGDRLAIGVPRGPREALKAYAMTHGRMYPWDGSGQYDEWVGDDPATGYPLTNVYLPLIK